MACNVLASNVSASGQTHDQLVCEALLARVKEVPKLLSEVAEEQIDQLGLVSWPKLAIKHPSFLHDEVVVVQEGLLNRGADFVVE